MRYVILIPAFNEEAVVEKTVKEALRHADEVLVVVDGATDNTRRLVTGISNVHVIGTTRNHGLASAMKRGFRYALLRNYDAVVKVDADGQMDLAVYDKLIQEYERTKSDVISATCKKDTPWEVRKDVWIYTALFNWASGHKLSDILSEYRLYSRRAMSHFVRIKHMGHVGYASNLTIIPIAGHGCICSEIREGVNYVNADKRPSPLGMLIDLRIMMVAYLWQYGTIRSRIISVISIPILTILLVLNLVIWRKHNSISWHRKGTE